MAVSKTTQIQNRDPEAFDAYAADYDAALNQGLRFTGESKEYFARTRIGWVRKVLGESFAPGWRCLDFGCGTGTAVPFLKDELEAAEIVGADTSEESRAMASRHHGLSGARFVHPDTLAGMTESFDFAYCNGVFHHIPPSERSGALQRVFAALKPGGWLAFWENNPWNPITRLLMRLVPFDRDAVLLWPSEARRLLRRSGLVTMRTDFLFIFPAALRFVRPLEPWLCKVPAGGQYLVLARKPGR